MKHTSPANGAEDLVQRGVAYLNQGQPWDALALFQRVLILNPDDVLANYNCGVAYHTLDDIVHATVCYQKAILSLPTFSAAHHNLGQAYTRQNNLPKAVDAYRNALRHDPADFKSAYNLCLVYRRLGMGREAIEAIETAIRVHPDSAQAFCILGQLYQEQDRYDEALVSIEQSLQIHENFAEAQYQKGLVYQKCGQYELGLAEFTKAIQNDPDLASAYWLYHLSLPMIYDTADQIETYRQRFRSALDQLVDSVQPLTGQRKVFALQGVQTMTNFFLQYQCRNDLALQKKYGRFASTIMAANFPHWAIKRSMPPLKQGAKVRIGYVSTYMYLHTVGTFLLGWLKCHNLSDFEIHAYHVGTQTDQMTRELRQFCHRFHYFAADMEAAARRIDSDDLHILIYTDVGMDPVTTQLAALRLAPVQCKGWGHPVTTGLPSMDYYLSSDLMEPDDAAAHYSEALVRLPNLALHIDPPQLPKNPKTRHDLGLPVNRFIFLTTQSIFKYLPQHDDIYPRIAMAVPHALFVFLRHQSEFATMRFKERLQKAFATLGMDANHYCHFSPRLNPHSFYSLNLVADVLLDSLEWSGGKTTLEALSCGLPVVTVPGRFMRGRHAYAMLKMIGTNETIASDKADYCKIAARLANEPDFLTHIRTHIVKHRRRFYQDRTFMTALEDFMRTLVS